MKSVILLRNVHVNAIRKRKIRTTKNDMMQSGSCLSIAVPWRNLFVVSRIAPEFFSFKGVIGQKPNFVINREIHVPRFVKVTAENRTLRAHACIFMCKMAKPAAYALCILLFVLKTSKKSKNARLQRACIVI